ncbi:MAG: hypothetical protein WD989_01345 [Candidatus Paceibacterota bacterium]
MKVKILFFSILALIAVEGFVLLEPDLSFVTNALEKLDVSDKTLAEYAEKVLAACADAPYAPNCYDTEIPKLMDYISMEDAFSVTRVIQEKDKRYLYCHVLGHNLSYREADKDPDKWMDVITRCPATMCNNGCLHGSMMRRFNSEYLTDEQIEALKPDLKIICEPRGKWKPTPIEQSMCYHAIGHLHMYITNADLNKSADLCELVGAKEDGRNYVQTCTEGVFMQVFQPLEPEDFALVANLTPAKNKVVEFCEPFKSRDMAWEACRRESWPLFRAELMDSKFVEKFCSFSDRPYAYKTCQAAIMNVITVNLVVDMDDMAKLDKFCMGLSTDLRREECFAYSASRLMQIDPSYVQKGLEVCALSESRGVSTECYKVMAGYGRQTYHKETKEFEDYCGKMPGQWKDMCLNNQSR